MDTIAENYNEKEHELNLINIFMKVCYQDFYDKHV